jgi:hypothetical protein
MTVRKPFDRFNKSLFRELLSPFGQVVPNMAVLGEERMIDVFFVPNPEVELDMDGLGDLASLVTEPALFEPFRSALTDDNVQSCLMKLFMVYADIQRVDSSIVVTEKPKLWILAAEVSDRCLTDFGGVIDPELGEGFYRLTKGLGTTIVAISELPTVPQNLLLRLLGKGRTQEDAIEELLLLPESDGRRSSALGLLTAWRITIEWMDEVDPEERQILMALSQAYLEWETETKRQGIEQGIEQGQRSMILSVMRFRYGAIDPELESIIPDLIALDPETSTQLLMQSSREALVAHFQS